MAVYQCPLCDCLMPENIKNEHVCNEHAIDTKRKNLGMASKFNEEAPRIITVREMFDLHIKSIWQACKEIAKTEIPRDAKELNIPYTMSDILSATAQLAIAWQREANHLEYLKNAKQKEIDERFNQRRIKNGNSQ